MWSGSWDKTVCVVKIANFSSSHLHGEELTEIETEFEDFESTVEIVEVQPQIKKGITRKFTNFINPSK